MLLDRQRHVVDVDLLDHPGHDRRHGLQVMPATGTKIEAMVERNAVDLFRWEGGAFVLGVSGLSTDAASLLALRRRRLGRLDDIGRRRLGGGRGILPGRRELLLESSDGGLKRLNRPAWASTLPASADNSGKTSVPWFSWRPMLHP